MASTYSTNLALELIGTGEQSGTWGTTTNTNLGTLLEQAISGYVTQAITDGASANTTITIPNGTTGVARNMFIEMTGALSVSSTSLIVPANKKMYFIFNNTSGGFAVTVKVSGQTGILVPNGKKVILTCNGTDIVEAHTAIVGNATMGGTLGVTGNTTLTGTLAVNTSGITTTATTFALLNATATTVNAFGAATALNLGGDTTIWTPTTGTTITLRTATATTATLFNTVATTVNFAGAATTLAIGAATGTMTLANATVAITNAATVGTTLGVTGNTQLGGIANPGYLLDVAKANANANIIALRNTTNSGSAGAQLYLEVAGTSAGNPYIDMNVTGGQRWRVGADNAAADGVFFINNSTNDSTNTPALTITAANAVTIPGTLGVTGTITPGQTTGIVGTTTTNDAQAGSVGETVMSSITSPTNYPATGTFGDLTSISLTAGDWDIAAVTQQTTPGTMTGETRLGISTTSGNSATGLTIGYNRLAFPNATATADSGASIPMYRLQLGSTTTVYLKFFTEYTTGTPKALGTIIARRRR